MTRISTTALLIVCVFFCGEAAAGGASFMTQIVQFDTEGKDRYRVVMLWPRRDGATNVLSFIYGTATTSGRTGPITCPKQAIKRASQN